MNRRETERVLAIRASSPTGQRGPPGHGRRRKGNAYRREGARIVVFEDGTYECLLSGGCLEPTVADAAARVIATGAPVIRQYNLEEDSVWSLGIGCSGAVDIYIERLDDDPVTRAWLEVLDRAEAAVLVRSLTGSGRMVVREHEIVGSVGDATLDTQAIQRSRARLDAPFGRSGVECVEATELFFEASAPPPELINFGAGFDAVPLAQHGWELGFAVTVVDVREAFLRADRFPHATLVSAHFSRFPEAVRLTERSFVITMNHHLERDRESLRFALSSRCPYVGVLGPRSRFQKLLAALETGGAVIDAVTLSRVRSPVGLALGAETPEEIAVSILGEIVALQNGFDGGFLTGRESGLHLSSRTSSFARS
jgi:xanthine/CO dehydrogenase XdhC/CoxF family maturation factor